MTDYPDLVVDETQSAQSKAVVGTRLHAHGARRVLQQYIKGLIEQALYWHGISGKLLPDNRIAPHSAIKITPGIGKSEQLRQEIIQFVGEAKRQKLPHRVLLTVPTHRLADEAQGRMPDGVTTTTWQGRNGTKLGTDEPMCRNLEAVDAALKIGAKVEETACKRQEARCPFYVTCHYQAQKAEARAADVVFAAHEIMFHLPKTLGQNFGLVVVDEAFWQDGLVDTRLAIAGLAHELAQFPVRDYDSTKLSDETAHLRELIERVQRALTEMPDGYVHRAPLIEEGLLPATQYEDGSCAIASKLEWKRKVDSGLRPGARAEERQSVVNRFAFMGQLPRRVAMWRALDELLKGSDEATGRLRIETVTTKEGTQRWLRVIGRKEIAKTIAGLPLIHADATLPFEIVRHYLPNLWLALDHDVETPHMRVVQVIGLPVGKASLRALTGKRSDDEEARVGRKRQRLVDVVRRLRAGLVITYKDIEDDFRQIESVEVAHFNAIEGIDRWRNVGVVVTIGRPLPRPQDIERMAAAITGKPVIAGSTIEQERAIRGAGHGGRDGGVLKCRVYAVPEAELIRQAVAEAAVLQAVGRVRGVNRTAANPVEVFMILHDTVTSVPVNEVVEFADLEPDAIDEMIARGLVPQFGSDAAKLYPDLFPNAAAAKRAYRYHQLNVERGTRRRGPGQGRRRETNPYREESIRVCPSARVARYQPSGRSQHKRLARADLAKVPDARAALEAVLGQLVLFEWIPEPHAGTGL